MPIAGLFSSSRTLILLDSEIRKGGVTKRWRSEGRASLFSDRHSRGTSAVTPPFLPDFLFVYSNYSNKQKKFRTEQCPESSFARSDFIMESEGIELRDHIRPSEDFRSELEISKGLNRKVSTSIESTALQRDSTPG